MQLTNIVDGYDERMVIDFGNDNDCPKMRAYISQKELEEICPAKNLITAENGRVSCYGNCRVAINNNEPNIKQTCCTEYYNDAKRCQLNNYHFHEHLRVGNPPREGKGGRAFVYTFDNDAEKHCYIGKITQFWLAGGE